MNTQPTRVGWPLYALFLGFPLWWLLGFSAVGWVVFSVPMLAWLVMRRNLVVPRGFWVWVFFLVWMLASAVQLPHDVKDWMVFAFRAAEFLSATVFLLYVLNIGADAMPAATIVNLLAAFFVMLVIWGYLGLAFPDVSFRSALEVALPGSVTGVQYIELLIHPRLAEVQNFIGYTVNRPSAPFPYTNWWGGNLGALVPFVLCAVELARRPRIKVLLWAALIAALVPAILSLNRGLWLSVGLALTYALVRLAIRGARVAGGILVFAVIVTAVVLGPFRGTISDRLERSYSAAGRASVIRATVSATAESPLLGYGVPGEKLRSVANLTVGGTGGIIWLILYTTGFAGGIAFAIWVAWVAWSTRRAVTPVQFWAHVSTVIVFIQIFYYEMLPAELHVLMIAAALAWREAAPAPVHGDADAIPAAVASSLQPLGARAAPLSARPHRS